MSLERGSIYISEHGEYHAFQWRIQDFSTLDETDGAYYDSPDFLFGGEIWYLKIFPNGVSYRGTSGHVDLALFKYPSGRSTRLSYSFSLKTAKGEKYKEQHVTKDFVDGDHTLNRFLPRAELTRLSSDLLPDDVLTVVGIMKESTSAGSESDPASAEISDSAGCSSDSGECRHCKGNFGTGILSSHQRKCEQRPVKCPDCLEVVVLEKFLNEHECQPRSPEGTRSSSEVLKRMLFDGRHHDLILKVGDKELRAHRDVLRARSRVFESMLDHDMKEKNTGVIDVPDCDPDAMQLFLSYVYCGKIEGVDHSNMLGLYYIADKYEMTELKSECSDIIRKSLSRTNICSIIQLALNHSDSDLLDSTTVYFANNMLDIMKTVEWQSFLKENSTVGNELMIKSLELKNAQS